MGLRDTVLRLSTVDSLPAGLNALVLPVRLPTGAASAATGMRHGAVREPRRAAVTPV